MKTSNDQFLTMLAKKALEKANELDTDEPKLVWPEKLESLPKQDPKKQRLSNKPYPLQEEGLVMTNKEAEENSLKLYRTGRETANPE